MNGKGSARRPEDSAAIAANWDQIFRKASPTAKTGFIGLRGFDCNTPVSAAAAKTMFELGYRFALRYVPRDEQTARHQRGRSTESVAAGLAVMPVQHVESETSWMPSANKGYLYGFHAARAAKEAGISLGTTVWLDLEGVALVDPQIVMDYCTEWHSEVLAAGYRTGVYVGWHSRLTPAQLYSLPFRHYWSAYNLNSDEMPAVRGVQMKQRVAKAGDDPRKLGIQTDVICGDALGGLPTLHAPEGWPG